MNALCSRKQLCSSTQQQELIEENHSLIYSFLKHYHLDINEYYDIAAIGLCVAATTYDEEKALFSTYAYKCMYHEVSHEIRKWSADKRIPLNKIVYYQDTVLDEEDITFLDQLPANDNVEATVVFYETINDGIVFNDRERYVLKLISIGLTQKEIASVIGCSQPSVSRILKKARECFEKGVI